MITHTISLLGLRDSNEDQHEVFINLNNNNSDYKNIELLIIDNGSQDGSVDYLTKLTKTEIQVILNNRNLGLANARNQGIIASKGEYLLFVDDDNVIDKSMITTLLQFFKEHKAAGIVTPKTLYKDNPKKIWFYGANINMFTSKAEFFYSNVIENEDRVNHEIEINCVHNCFMVRKIFSTKWAYLTRNFLGQLIMKIK